MKIYLVTYGCYSDYEVERVFLSKEKAFCWAAAENSKSNTYYHVEEYETSDDSFLTDGKVETQVHFKVTVVVDKAKSVNKKEPGVVFRIQGGDLWGVPYVEYHEPQVHEFVSGYRWGVDIWAGLYDTEEKIIKIAQDMYYQWRAEHELEFVPEEHTLYFDNKPAYTIVQFCNHSEKLEDGNKKDEEVWCTECPYFKFVADDDDSWYGTKCHKDGHEANPSMYAIQSLHDDCPLKKDGESDVQ